MTKFNKIAMKYRWVFAPVMYVAICVWIFLTAEASIEGYQLDQTTAGTYALIAWHTMLLVAFAGAWLLHKIVELFSRIKEYFKNWRNV